MVFRIQTSNGFTNGRFYCVQLQTTAVRLKHRKRKLLLNKSEAQLTTEKNPPQRVQ